MAESPPTTNSGRQSLDDISLGQVAHMLSTSEREADVEHRRDRRKPAWATLHTPSHVPYPAARAELVEC